MMSDGWPDDRVPEELVVAGLWWRSQLLRHDSIRCRPESAEIFFDQFVGLLLGNIRHHWYPEEPLRGQAYRFAHTHLRPTPTPTLPLATCDEDRIRCNRFQ